MQAQNTIRQLSSPLLLNSNQEDFDNVYQLKALFLWNRQT